MSQLVVSLILTTLCLRPAAANEVQYVVYVDELGTAFYLSSHKAAGCINNPWAGAGYYCKLTYTAKAGVNGGVPTITFRGLAQAYDVNAGDILMIEAGSGPQVKSDVIRFPTYRTDPQGRDRANSLLFYSAPDDKDTDHSIDKPLPSTSTPLIMPEVDLGSIVPPSLNGYPGAALNIPLRGKGIYYTAAPKAVGGTPEYTGLIGYIFVSDIPEPSTVSLMLLSFVVLCWCTERRQRQLRLGSRSR